MTDEIPTCDQCGGTLIGGAILAMDWRTNEQRVFDSYTCRILFREAQAAHVRQPPRVGVLD